MEKDKSEKSFTKTIITIILIISYITCYITAYRLGKVDGFIECAQIVIAK